jgi:hypothetical protein
LSEASGAANAVAALAAYPAAASSSAWRIRARIAASVATALGVRECSKRTDDAPAGAPEPARRAHRARPDERQRRRLEPRLGADLRAFVCADATRLEAHRRARTVFHSRTRRTERPLDGSNPAHHGLAPDPETARNAADLRPGGNRSQFSCPFCVEFLIARGASSPLPSRRVRTHRQV